MTVAFRTAYVYVRDIFAGTLSETDDGYRFVYDDTYLNTASVLPVSLTLPLSQVEYTSKTLFPFFDGLIPEGWLLDIAQESWKLNPRDRMGLLLSCCRKCIGAVSVEEVKDGE